MRTNRTEKNVDILIKGIYFMLLTCRRQPQCGVYLLFLFLSTTICIFGECHPPETARIARLTACYAACIIPNPKVF
jgi:hypothetical protein